MAVDHSVPPWNQHAKSLDAIHSWHKKQRLKQKQQGDSQIEIDVAKFFMHGLCGSHAHVWSPKYIEEKDDRQESHFSLSR